MIDDNEREGLIKQTPEPPTSAPAAEAPTTAEPTAPEPWTPRRVWGILRQSLSLFVFFLLLSSTYALYFVLMLYFNDRCSINPWGFNAFDQVTLPVFLYLAFFLGDLVGFVRNATLIGDDAQESFLDAVKGSFRNEITESKGLGLLNMFCYRLLINARAIGYSFITVHYDLANSYLQLTLVRVVLSWLASLVIVLLGPKFIMAMPEERRKALDKVNLTLKAFGSAAIIGALLIMYL